MPSSSSSDLSRKNRTKRGRKGRSRVSRLEKAVLKLTATVSDLVNRDLASNSSQMGQESRKRSRSLSISSDESVRIRAPIAKKKIPSNGPCVDTFDINQPPSGDGFTLSNSNEPDVLVIKPLDSEVAALLGDVPQSEPPKGASIHDEIAARWNMISKKGLTKDERDRFVTRFPRPKNFEAIGSHINPELISVIPDPVKIRDESLRRVQDHISFAAGALAKVISTLLSSESEIDRNTLLSDLSDTGRYLVGTQYSLSLFRRKQISSQIKDTAMSQVLTTSEIYPKLFGSDLSSEIKAAKAMYKVGHDIANKSAQSKLAASSYQTKPRSHSRAEPTLNSKRPFPSHKIKYQSQYRPRGNRNGPQASRK